MSKENRIGIDGAVEQVDFKNIDLIDLVRQVNKPFNIQADTVRRAGIDGMEVDTIYVVSDNKSYQELLTNSEEGEK